MDRAPYRRRNSREPAPGREHPIERPSPRDLGIFQLLDPVWGFKYLTSEWIQYFFPAVVIKDKKTGQLKAIYNSQRLGWLQERPNYFLKRPKQQLNSPNSNYHPHVYERDEAAVRHLVKLNLPVGTIEHRSNSYPHEFLVDMGFYAPMRFAVDSDPDLTLTGAYDLLRHPNVPAKTRNLEDRAP